MQSYLPLHCFVYELGGRVCTLHGLLPNTLDFSGPLGNVLFFKFDNIPPVLQFDSFIEIAREIVISEEYWVVESFVSP